MYSSKGGGCRFRSGRDQAHAGAGRIAVTTAQGPNGDRLSQPRYRRLYYLVALMSNVLGKVSAVDHQTLATRLHRLIENRHPIRPSATPR
ncbi:MAG: hypothetical protein ACREXW_03010 [Gammaproteobacteria bacterium]